MNKTRLFFVLMLLLPAVFFAQDFEWLPGGTYDPAIPSPKSVLGYEIGTYLTDHLQMVDYIHRLAESSERVEVFEFGETYEKRKMYLLAIGSPENMKKLEDIRTTIARLTDPRKTTPAEAESIAKETPPIGWINFGTDGNETSAFECSMQLAYQLAAGSDPLTMKILENVVTIINPVLSPDSHQWFATWAKAMTIGNPGTPDPTAAEHQSAWFVSTDGNHYLIDVNRDAFALTQLETQAMAKVLHHWNPQIWADNHGQPEEYFFAPFASPVNLNYPPSTLKWATEVGKNIVTLLRSIRLDLRKSRALRPLLPRLLGCLPVFQRRHRHDLRNQRWRQQGFRLRTIGRNTLDTAGVHPLSFHGRHGHAGDPGGQSRGDTHGLLQLPKDRHGGSRQGEVQTVRIAAR